MDEASGIENWPRNAVIGKAAASRPGPCFGRDTMTVIVSRTLTAWFTRDMIAAP